jgi:hypothetical protein
MWIIDITDEVFRKENKRHEQTALRANGRVKENLGGTDKLTYLKSSKGDGWQSKWS